MRIRKLLFSALFAAGALASLPAPARAQDATYFPFGAVAIGTPGSGIRVGPLGCLRTDTPAPVAANAQIIGVACDSNGSIRTVSQASQSGPWSVEVFGNSAQPPVEANLTDPAGTPLSFAADVPEDAPETPGGSGPLILGVRRDVAVSSAGTSGDNATFNTDSLGLLWTRRLDPCDGVTKVSIPISISTPTTTELLDSTGASTKGYICSITLVTAAANNVALVEDATDVCASPDAGMSGGTTAATGWNFAANGGLALSGGGSYLFKTASTNVRICLITSASTQLSGTIVYALAP